MSKRLTQQDEARLANAFLRLGAALKHALQVAVRDDKKYARALTTEQTRADKAGDEVDPVIYDNASMASAARRAAQEAVELARIVRENPGLAPVEAVERVLLRSAHRRAA